MRAVTLSTHLNRFAAVVRSRIAANGPSTTLDFLGAASASPGRRGRWRGLLHRDRLSGRRNRGARLDAAWQCAPRHQHEEGR